MNCDKCNQPVERTNDAVHVEAIASGNSFMILFAQSRHFLPTDTCPGSPSRAQYINGQPRDTRYPYIPEYAALYQAAYAQLLSEH